MKKCITILFLALTTILHGTIYYVAPTGGSDSNPGTEAQPWATWQRAIDMAQAGDTVYFRGGVWYPTNYTDNRNTVVVHAPREIAGIYEGTTHGYSGTVGNPVCFFNYPGEVPVLDCSNVDTVGHRFNTGLGFILSEYIHIKGLTVRNVYQPYSGELACGVGSDASSHMIFENMNVYNIGGRGMTYWGANGYFGIVNDSVHYYNCDIHNCYDPLSEVPGNGSDGWKGGNEPGGYFYFEGCRAWDCADDGFDVSGNSYAEFNNCWSWSHGWLGEGLDGNGFKFGAISDSFPNPMRKITRCLAAFNRGQGYYDLEYADYYRNNSRIYNNTAYKNGYGFGGSSNTVRPYRLSQYYNNIAYASTELTPAETPYNAAILDETYVESNNTWTLYDPRPGSWPWFLEAIVVTDADFVSVDSTGISGSRKADGSLPDISFLKLAATSDLIDGGIDVGLSYSGAAPDLGYSEFYNKKTVFIHHSSGGNWVADAWGGLGDAMNDAGYFFSGIDYGWDAPYNTNIGDYTDIGDWWTWFMDQTVQGNSEARRDNIMGAVYTEYDKDIQFGDYTRTLSDPGGENEIIMFKSCYPNSDIIADNSTTPTDIYGDPAGSTSYTETNVRALYDTILTYFKANPGRMFVVITAPPLSAATNAARARSFNNWLVDNWLQDADWENKNVYVWDWYNVLTDADNHHRVEDGVVVHTTDPTSGNTAIYVDGDDHPNAAGCQKSTAEFVPVLDLWYSTWSNFSTPTEEPVASTATDILSFTLADQTGAATINSMLHTVAIEVDYTADITNISPTITLSYGATVIPASGVARDFTNPVPYTVTAQDETTTQEWVVTVTQAEEPAAPAGSSRIVKYRGLIMKL